MNWQEPVVVFIVGLCAGVCIYRFVSFFRKPKKEDDTVCNCSCNCCNLKKMKKKKQIARFFSQSRHQI
ncbi:hypothetical protein EZS27_017555 [termite gut metagenome]|uniref:FeoB-associated Cys-rich membrane protein n=1 Tax=termite gut metagenome TaxID=433724 RepID=A0A5J4RKL8_9ZZZZ